MNPEQVCSICFLGNITKMGLRTASGLQSFCRASLITVTQHVCSLYLTAFCRSAKRRLNCLPALQDRLMMQRSDFFNQKMAAREEKLMCESCHNYFKTACGKKIRPLWIGVTEKFPSSWGEDVLTLCGYEMQILLLLLTQRRINCVYHFRIRLITVGVFRLSIVLWLLIWICIVISPDF